MIKEANNIDFYTISKQPSEQDFARISAWIKQHRLASAKKRRANKKRQVKAAVG